MISILKYKIYSTIRYFMSKNPIVDFLHSTILLNLSSHIHDYYNECLLKRCTAISNIN